MSCADTGGRPVVEGDRLRPPESWPGTGGRRSVAPDVPSWPGAPRSIDSGSSWPGAEPRPRAATTADPARRRAWTPKYALAWLVPLLAVSGWVFVDGGHRGLQLAALVIVFFCAAAYVGVWSALERAHRGRGHRPGTGRPASTSQLRSRRGTRSASRGGRSG